MTRDFRNRRGESLHRLHHHLEDQIDRDLDRYFGAGKARRRDTHRRQEQYARLAERLFHLALRGELRDPAYEDVVLERVELHSGSSMLTLWVALPPERDAAGRRTVELRLAGVQGLLRAALARHLPRKRIPEVRIRVLGGER